MTPNQYRAAIEKLGLTQVGAARFLGVDARTSRRWAHIAGPPETVAKFLRFLIAAKVTPEEVEGALKKG